MFHIVLYAVYVKFCRKSTATFVKANSFLNLARSPQNKSEGMRHVIFQKKNPTSVPTEVYVQCSVKGLQGMLTFNWYPYVLWHFGTNGTNIIYHQSGIGPPLSIIVHMGTIILLPKNEEVPPLSIIVHMGIIILRPKNMTPPWY